MISKLPEQTVSHRHFFVLCAMLLIGIISANAQVLADTMTSVESTAGNIPVKMFKNPTCGCCGKWAEHMQDAGFSVTVEDSANMSDIKSRHGIAAHYQSCHTAIVDGYVFEGHIPATLVRRFLQEKPANAIGLSVPGMPIGSPGMEMGSRQDAYDVLLLKTDGSSSVYQHVNK